MAKKCRENDAEIRKMILDAAEKIGKEQGIDKITARRISEAIGYSTGVIYYHFQNKQEIMDLLSQSYNSDIYDTMQKRIDPNGTLRENNCRMMECIYHMVISNRNTDARLLIEGSCVPDKGSPWMDIARCILDIAAKKGEILPDSIEDAAYCLCSFFVGYGLLLLENCPQDVAAAKCKAERVIDVLLHGFLMR